VFIHALLKKQIRKGAILLCRSLKGKLSGQGFYQNINYDPTKMQKRVLISYITYPFEHEYTGQVRHTSQVEVAIIIKAFIEKGCIVDVIDCENLFDIQIVEQKHYDYIFGFGKPWSAAVDANPDGTAIMYLTECAPSFSEQREQARLEYYKLRHGKKLTLVRSNRYFIDEHIKKAKYGFLLGNRYTAATYEQQYPLLKIRLLSPSGFINKAVNKCPRLGDKTSFLWFGSFGAIHKGLDILLDVFKDIPDAKLYVAGLSDREKWILEDYGSYTNIINLGFLDVQSKHFLRLVNEVTYCILPSASEGMSTSVLTCMRHGLIPVITSSCGIDVNNYGYIIDDYHVEPLKKLLQDLMRVPDVELRQKQCAVFKYANIRYCLENFAQEIRTLVDSIC